MVNPIATAVDEKGRVAVPEALLKEIGLEAPLKAVAWREHDQIRMMVVPANSGEAAWAELCEEMDKKNITMSEEEVVEEVHAYRREKRHAALEASKVYNTAQMYLPYPSLCPDEREITSAWCYRF